MTSKTNRRGVGPLPPSFAVPGGIPTVSLDVPVTAAFLLLFVIGGAFHFTMHEKNGKRGHKFHLSAVVFDFCLVRVITCAMRIVWAFSPDNNGIIVAALIFENAGAVVLFAVNSVLTQRIIRAIHPGFGWYPAVNNFFLVILFSVPVMIIYNIIFFTIGFFALDTRVLDVARGLLLFGISYNTFLSILPILLIPPAAIIPNPSPVEKFALGRFRTKIIVLLFSSALLSTGAIIRLLTAINPRPANYPAKIDSKEVFYTTGFMLEIIVVIMFAIVRLDLLFWVPNGCKGPGDYRYLIPQRDANGKKLYQYIDVRLKMKTHYGTYTRDSSSTTDLCLKPTREQVRQAIYNLGIQPEVTLPPIVDGESEILVYAIRVRKLETEDQFDGIPRPLPCLGP